MMKRFYSISQTFLVTLLSVLSAAHASAQEIYKWTDANGKVHYGDRAAAPENSTKMTLRLPPPSQPEAAPVSGGNAQRGLAVRPQSNPQEKSVPVDPARVGPLCQSLIGKIAAVPAGGNWENLYRQFDAACPRIAYECVEYESRPQDNRCHWVERSGSRVLNRKQYP
ncbi:MAG: DUF4124 domain-containing protein [Pseudomonadota bacterium]